VFTIGVEEFGNKPNFRGFVRIILAVGNTVSLSVQLGKRWRNDGGTHLNSIVNLKAPSSKGVSLGLEYRQIALRMVTQEQ
jgi:hypothetical protein